jgi:hypothetical protein
MAVSDTARAGVEQGNSIITTGIKAVEAVVNAIRSLPFPLNIAAGAATAAVIASLGVAIGGAFGGGRKPAPTNDGTGTVFGDSAAKSESIAKSIDHLREIDTLTMRYSASMLESLRGIEANIGGLTNLIIRTNGGEASANGIQTGFKTSISGVLGAILGPVGSLIKSLFGTKTTIIGQGIYGGAQSLGGIVDGGFQGQYYTDLQKKKKFLGITTGTSYSTQYSAASAELERQFSQIFTGFYDTISASAGPLGLSLNEVQARLDSFVVNIGKIDLKGLTGQQIQERLAAVFGAAADNLARYAIAGLDQFQKVGEGYFETLVRVASSVEAVASSVTMLGRSANLTIAASMDLVDRFGSASDMLSATGEYFSLYYSNAEQAAARTAQMTAAQMFNGGLTTQILVGGGASAFPVWTAATGTGAPVRATSPTIVSPTINGTVAFASYTVSGINGTSAAAPTIASATTIAPTQQIAFVSGTTAIATITPPAPIASGGGRITLIPTGAFTTTTAGNIALASVAVVNKTLTMTYDTTTTKWYPSY